MFKIDDVYYPMGDPGKDRAVIVNEYIDENESKFYIAYTNRQIKMFCVFSPYMPLGFSSEIGPGAKVRYSRPT